MPARDGLKGLPEAVETVWPRTIVQTCIVHLPRDSTRHAARQNGDKTARLLKPVCTAPTEETARDRSTESADAWGRKYPAGGQGPWTLPQRAGRPEVRLPGPPCPSVPRARARPAGPCTGRPH
jgi:hypothetical protein